MFNLVDVSTMKTEYYLRFNISYLDTKQNIYNKYTLEKILNKRFTIETQQAQEHRHYYK